MLRSGHSSGRIFNLAGCPGSHRPRGRWQRLPWLTRFHRRFYSDRLGGIMPHFASAVNSLWDTMPQALTDVEAQGMNMRILRLEALPCHSTTPKRYLTFLPPSSRLRRRGAGEDPSPHDLHTPPLRPYGGPNVIPGSLSAIVRSFKASVTWRIHNAGRGGGVPVWQRNYYEHIIRNPAELQRIQEYILNNPLRWGMDELYIPR